MKQPPRPQEGRLTLTQTRRQLQQSLELGRLSQKPLGSNVAIFILYTVGDNEIGHSSNLGGLIRKQGCAGNPTEQFPQPRQSSRRLLEGRDYGSPRLGWFSRSSVKEATGCVNEKEHSRQGLVQVHHAEIAPPDKTSFSLAIFSSSVA